MRRNEADRGWWARNWGWCVGCGCLLPVLVVGACGYGATLLGKRLFSSNGALETAIERVNEDPRATELLGSPIEPELWRENTEIRLQDRTMRARFGVRGPRGEGRLRVEAHTTGDGEPWVIDRLQLDADGLDEPLNLLDRAAPEPRGDPPELPEGPAALQRSCAGHAARHS